MQAWKKISSEYVLRNRWYKVRRDKVTRPDGSDGEFNVVECGESVFILAVDADKNILLVKLFRYPTQDEGWELPAGGVEEGETPLAAAKRELREETGLHAESWRELGTFDAMNGMTDSVVHVFAAADLRPAGSDEQAEEGISRVEAFPPQAILHMIRTGDMVDGVSIAALTKAFAATDQLVLQTDKELL